MKIYIDISNYVQTRSLTGIQRVIKEFLLRLLSEKQIFEYIIIYFDDQKQQFNCLDRKELLQFLQNVKSYQFKNYSYEKMDSFESDSYFFDLDAAWHIPLDRSILYSKLKSQQVKILNFIYDLTPFIIPQLSHQDTLQKFTAYINVIFTYSDFVFFDSRSAEEDFNNVKKKFNITKSINSRVIKLGSDISVSSVDKEISLELQQLTTTKYILFVGTLEPRKDHTLMLDVFEMLAEKYSDLNLLFVGKLGWNSETLAERIMSHHLKDNRLYWLDTLNDDELTLLYESSFIVVYLSKYEGFGLPIAESLKYGNITISSKNSSMYEVGKNFVDYIEYNSINELYEIIALYYENRELFNKKKIYIKSKYHAYSWDMTYKSICNVLTSFEEVNRLRQKAIPKLLQFVFISINPSELAKTIKIIDQKVSFVKEYIVVTQSSLMTTIQKINSIYSIKVIDESSILGKYSDGFSERDHQSKNWLLRASLLNLSILDNEFIMLDDDNRPLIDVNIDFYIDKDRKYNAYYFYNLLYWHEHTTEYDIGQQHTKEVLDREGLELLSYSSHMPQIINKEIWQEVVNKYFEIGLEQPIDEWSIYFNYAISKYPSLFNKKVFETMNWPAKPSYWNLQFFPEKYSFENYYRNEQFARGNFSYQQKVEIKKNELSPYMSTKKLMKNISEYYRDNNIVHGQIQFKLGSLYCTLSNIPYVIAGQKGTWIKLPINFKILNNTEGEDIFIYYIVNSKVGARIKLPYTETKNDYNEDIINIPIFCPKTSKKRDVYDLLFDIEISGQSVYAAASPYLVKLLTIN